MASDVSTTSSMIAGIASAFIPGFGQLLQGRIATAIFHFVFDVFLWLVTFGLFGWPMHIYSAWDAAQAARERY